MSEVGNGRWMIICAVQIACTLGGEALNYHVT